MRLVSAFTGPSPEGGRAVGSNLAVLCAEGEKSADIWEEMRCPAMHWTNVFYHEGSWSGASVLPTMKKWHFPCRCTS